MVLRHIDKLTMSQVFLSMSFTLQENNIIVWGTGYKCQLFSPAYGIQEVAIINKNMPSADSEPILLNSCSCANALASACKKYSCHPASHIFQIFITHSNLLVSPLDARAYPQEELT